MSGWLSFAIFPVGGARIGATAGGIGGVNNNIVGTGGGRGGTRGRSGKTKPPRYSTQMAGNSQMSHNSAMISQSSQVSWLGVL